MSKIRLHGSSSGYMEIAPPAAGSSETITLPNSAGEVLLSDGSAANLTQIPAANIVGVCTAGLGNASGAFGQGKILQVLQATKTDNQSFTSSGSGDDRYDITGLSVSITPSSSSNKILITYNVNVGGPNGGYRAFLHLMRESTDIYRGDDASSRTRCSNFIYTRNDSVGHVASYQNTGTFLDTPGDTNSHTYKIQITTHNSGGNVYYVNTAGSNPSSTSGMNPISQITVMEVAA